MAELHHLSAVEQLRLMRRGDVTPLELADHYLARIDRINGDVGAFTTVTPQAARDRAIALTGEDQRALPLWGLPSGDKDLWARRGVATGYGSRLFADYVPQQSDEIVDALDAAGSVSLGKTSTPEFGLSSYTESLVAPPARVPWDLSLGAGGSSGGAAVAVSAGLLPLALGSDGGGSVRIPAAATGLVGLKPSRGRIPSGSGFHSPGGLVVAGPLARSVADAALMLDALAGESPWSVGPVSWNEGPYLGAAVRGEGKFQLGVMTTSPWDNAYDITISPEATDALNLAVRHLDQLGHGIDELNLEPDDGYPEAFRAIWQAGAAGIPADGEQLELLEPLTAWLVERGRALGAREYGAALQWLSNFERSIIRQFSVVDVVVTPAVALTPRPVGWYDSVDPERNFEQQVQYTPWTSFVNVAGLPAISLPVGQTETGLPMGVQLIGRPGREDVLLAIGAQLERRLRWQERHPSMW